MFSYTTVFSCMSCLGLLYVYLLLAELTSLQLVLCDLNWLTTLNGVPKGTFQSGGGVVLPDLEQECTYIRLWYMIYDIWYMIYHIYACTYVYIYIYISLSIRLYQSVHFGSLCGLETCLCAVKSKKVYQGKQVGTPFVVWPIQMES